MKTYLPALLIIGITGISLTDFKPYDMKNIDAFLKQQVDQHQTPSIRYAFFDSNSIIYQLGYGVKQVKQQLPIDSTTTYHLFSITKTFTSLAVLQLAEQGKLDLAQPIVNYLPSFPYNKAITIAQLLNHTSGIPNPMPLRWIHLASEHQSFRHDEFFDEIFRKHPDLDFAPGSDFKYSNLGYVFLGQLVEKISGETYEQYITKNIIAKAGIASTDLSFTIDDQVHATGYHAWWSITNAALSFLIDKPKFMAAREGKWKPFQTFHNNGKAYGGLTGTVGGLVGYAQALIQDSSVLISDRYRDILFSDNKIDNKSTGMSFAWFTGVLKGHRYYAHAGGGGGYYVEVRIYPDLKVGSAIMYNRSGMKDERMLSKADGFFITE